MNNLSDFTIEKNDGACDTYTIKEMLHYGSPNKLHITCPKCRTTAIWRPDNTYICPDCKHIFTTEKFCLD